jgi:hypothetical protein
MAGFGSKADRGRVDRYRFVRGWRAREPRAAGERRRPARYPQAHWFPVAFQKRVRRPRYENRAHLVQPSVQPARALSEHFAHEPIQIRDGLHISRDHANTCDKM